MSFSLVFFASLQLDWPTTMGKLFGSAICLPHKDGGISLSILPKDTASECAGLFSILFALRAKQESYEYRFDVIWYDSIR